MSEIISPRALFTYIRIRGSRTCRECYSWIGVPYVRPRKSRMDLVLGYVINKNLDLERANIFESNIYSTLIVYATAG